MFESPYFLYFMNDDTEKYPFFKKVAGDIDNKPLKIIFEDSEKPRNMIERKLQNILKEIKNFEEFNSLTTKASKMLEKSKVFQYSTFILEENENFEQNGFKLFVTPVPEKTLRTNISYSTKESSRERFPVMRGSVILNDFFGRADRTKAGFSGTFRDKYKYRNWRLHTSFPCVFDNNGKLNFKFSRQTKWLSDNIIHKQIPISISYSPYMKNSEEKISFTFTRSFNSNIINNASSSKKLLNEQTSPSTSHALAFNYGYIFKSRFEFDAFKYSGELKFDNIYTNLLKTNINIKKRGDPIRKIKNYEKTAWNFFKFWSYENVFSFRHLLPLQTRNSQRKISINDKLFTSRTKGFESCGPFYSDYEPTDNKFNLTQSGDNIGFDGMIENSFKVMAHDYPILSIFRIKPFVHLTSVIPFNNNELVVLRKTNQDVWALLNNIRISAGFGLLIGDGNSTCEMCFNFYHLSMKNDKLAQFQISWEGV